MGSLVEHARRELEILGEDEETIDGLVAVVQAFADMGHSGTSAIFAISYLERLLHFENLSELTDNPDEWTDVSESSNTHMWQSKRNPAAFSIDDGKSYSLVTNNKISYKTESHEDSLNGNS